MVEFKPFSKIARLNRGMVITEKIDGTNAAVVIAKVPFTFGRFPANQNRVAIIVIDSDVAAATEDAAPEFEYHVYAQSRNRFVTPGSDNYGFAGWVGRNAEGLVKVLGEGYHYGEWWGSGIQRNYGLTGGDKRFSLFNTGRWATGNMDLEYAGVPGLGVVPELYRGAFDTAVVDAIVKELGVIGSVAAPGFDKPEGVVVYQAALRDYFKVTIENDESPKSAVE